MVYSKGIKLYVQNTIIENIAGYGLDLWDTYGRNVSQIIVTKMNCMRRCCKKLWLDRFHNDASRDEMEIQLDIIQANNEKTF